MGVCQPLLITQLTRLQNSRSRAYLTNQHRLTKPLQLLAHSKAASSPLQTSNTTRLPLPKIARAPVVVNSDGEENLDELDQDDFANMGSSDFGDSDDFSEMSYNDSVEEVDLGSELSSSNGDDLERSDDENEEEWAGIQPSTSLINEVAESSDSTASSRTLLSGSDSIEDRYAFLQSKRANRADAEEALKAARRLPIFMNGITVEQSHHEAQGKQRSKNRIAHLATENEAEEDYANHAQANLRRTSAATPLPNPFGARFGRPSILSILEIPSRPQRLQAAREELAQLGREMMAEPELGMNLLRRLLGFALPKFLPTGAKKNEGITVDTPIRSLAMLSMLAVFLDIIP